MKYLIAGLSLLLVGCQEQGLKTNEVPVSDWYIDILCTEESKLGVASFSALARILLSPDGAYVGRIHNSGRDSGLFMARVENEQLHVRIEYPNIPPIMATLVRDETNDRLVGLDSNQCFLFVKEPIELPGL